jgi:predicted RecA/RadA family phage recombinase
MKNYVKSGKTVELAAPAAMSSGDARIIGGLLAVAHTDLDSAERGSFETEGEFTLPKATGIAFAEGEICYWDDATQLFKKSASTFFGCATCTKAAVNADTEMQVKLHGVAVVAVP